MRVAVAAAVLLMVPWALAISISQPVQTAPASIAPPATLAAGTIGSTTLGASATSASTTLTSLPLTAAQALRIDRATGAWDVRIQSVSATGWGALDSITVSLRAGLTTTAEVKIVLGVLTQTIGSPMTLDATTTSLQAVVAGTKLSGGASVLTMDILLASAGGEIEARYRWTLTVT
jgi:hypothetical protein